VATILLRLESARPSLPSTLPMVLPIMGALYTRDLATADLSTADRNILGPSTHHPLMALGTIMELLTHRYVYTGPVTVSF